jgi:hypothetical protein
MHSPETVNREVQQVYLEVKPLSTLLAVLAEQELGLWDLSHTTLGDGQGQPTGASISLTDTEVQATRAHLRIPPATVRLAPVPMLWRVRVCYYPCVVGSRSV